MRTLVFEIGAATILAASAGFASESANYSLTPLTIDGGGLRAASASYAIDSSVAPGGSSTSVNYTARNGYAGSLFDILGLGLTASPLTVNEGATRQLSAFLLLDDASQLPLNPPSVTWSVVSGPLSGITAGGLATAGTVFQNTVGTARGDYQAFNATLGLTVLNVNSDNFGLYAGDGIADDWQVIHFGIDNPDAGPLLDPDHDGWINLFEYNAGLVPTDPFSVFYLREETVAGQPGQRRIIFRPRLAGSTYTVMASTNMQPGTWQPLIGATVGDSGDERTVTDPNASGPRKFYRVDVQKP